MCESVYFGVLVNLIFSAFLQTFLRLLLLLFFLRSFNYSFFFFFFLNSFILFSMSVPSQDACVVCSKVIKK